MKQRAFAFLVLVVIGVLLCNLGMCAEEKAGNYLYMSPFYHAVFTREIIHYDAHVIKKNHRSFLGGGGAFGYGFSRFRVELEGVLSKNKELDESGEDVTFGYTGALLNLYYDFASPDLFTSKNFELAPYFGLGCGLAVIDSRLLGLSSLGLNNSLQGKVGVKLKSSKSLMPYAGYRLIWMTNNVSGSGSGGFLLPHGARYFSNSVELGVTLVVNL